MLPGGIQILLHPRPFDRALMVMRVLDRHPCLQHQPFQKILLIERQRLARSRVDHQLGQLDLRLCSAGQSGRSPSQGSGGISPTVREGSVT